MPLATSTQLARLREQVGDLVESRKGRFDPRSFRKYENDPTGFAREVLGVKLWSKQEEIASSVLSKPLTVVRSCNSMGKDFVAAQLSLWWTYARGGLVLLTGSTSRQVQEILMREVARSFHRCPRLRGELFQLSLRVGRDDSRGILAFTSSESSKLSGFHSARGVFAVLTEAQACEAFAFEGMMACCTGEFDRVLAVGNPLSPTGRFYQISRPNSEWEKLRISAFEHPNVIGDDPSIIPGGVTKAFIERMASEYGRSSSVYIARVLGEFPETAADGLCQRAWLERAAANHESGAFEEQSQTEPFVAAVDPARLGPDKSVLAIRQGAVVREVVVWAREDLMTTTGLIIEELRSRQLGNFDRNRYGPGLVGRPVTVIVDEVGLGSGVLDRLAEQRYNVVGHNGSRKARDPRRFHNRRAEVYWLLRKKLELGDIALPRCEELFAELVAIRWGVDSSGRIQLERKEVTSARVGRSPDRADAVAMAFGEDETATVGGSMIDL